MKITRVAPFLPGKLTISRGTWRDYMALAPFHYAARHPRTYAQIWVVRYRDGPRARARPVAVGVLSYPMGSCAAREAYLRRFDRPLTENLRFVNRHVRVISRVIVHPQFRALGLSTLLVRTMCARCPTRYVEAIAAMGRVHPLFERAGMTRCHFRGESDRAAYFIFDRKENKS